MSFPSPTQRRPVSVRTRLIVWNSLILSLLLLTLGAALRYTLQVSLTAQFDASLRERGQRIVTLLPQLDNPVARNVLRRWHDSKVSSDGSIQTETPQADAESSPLDEEFGPPHRYSPRLLRSDGSLLLSQRSGRAYDLSALPRALARNRGIFTTVRDSGNWLRVYTLPLPQVQGQPAALQLAVSEEPIRHEVRRLLRTLLLLSPLALLLAGMGAAFLTDRALRPVREIQSAAASIGGTQDLSMRLPVSDPHGDEFTDLAITINEMLGRIEAAFLQQQRFTADASHELRTPLTTAKMGVDVALLAKERTPEEYRKALSGVGGNLDRMARLVDDLLLLARADVGQIAPLTTRAPIPLAALFEEVAALVRRTLPTDAPCFFLAPTEPSDLTICGDREALARLLRNLLENAARHTPPGGEIHLQVRASLPAQVTITVRDTGEGIPPEHLPYITERFYRVDTNRSRQAGGGSGLGLAICRDIAAAHGGSLRITSEVGVGTTVTVVLAREG